MLKKVKFHRTLPKLMFVEVYFTGHYPKLMFAKVKFHRTLPQADVRKGQISQGITPS